MEIKSMSNAELEKRQSELWAKHETLCCELGIPNLTTRLFGTLCSAGDNLHELSAIMYEFECRDCEEFRQSEDVAQHGTNH